jgi:hypothetical protein
MRQHHVVEVVEKPGDNGGGTEENVILPKVL